MNLIPGQGHFGPDAIPGDARWRRGESVSLKTARDTCGSSLKPSFTLIMHATTTTTPCTDTHSRKLAHRMVPLELAQHAQMVYTAR